MWFLVLADADYGRELFWQSFSNKQEAIEAIGDAVLRNPNTCRVLVTEVKEAYATDIDVHVTGTEVE